MSYILDALRRADAERERGRVPGIHAHATQPPADEAGVPRTTPPWRWIALGLGLGLLLMLAMFWFFGRDAAPPAPPPTAAMNPPPPIPARDVPVPIEARPVGPRPAEGPPPMPTGEPPRVPIEQRPTTAESAAAAKKAAAAARATAAASAATPATATPTPGAPAPGNGRIYARHELPDDIRRQLPPVTIGGSIYSPSAANRFVVINGQVVHEGGEIGPDHVLESIRLKSAVLRFKGYRYEILF